MVFFFIRSNTIMKREGLSTPVGTERFTRVMISKVVVLSDLIPEAGRRYVSVTCSDPQATPGGHR